MLIGVLALLGLVVGPLLGVAVDRAVERERPEPLHRCQHCGADMGPRSLLPVLGWFRSCPKDQEHRNWRYPLVDVSTALLFALGAWRFGTSWMLLPYLGLFAIMVVMSVIDVETHLLLNVLTFPAFGLGLFAVLTLSAPLGRAEAIWPALVGAGVFGAIILLSYLAYPPGMGLGDAKLAPTLGLFLGWLTTNSYVAARLSFYALIVGLLGAGVLGLTLRALKVLGPKAEIPMGPGLIGGTIVVIALSDQIALL